jgi:hypothetical protein
VNTPAGGVRMEFERVKHWQWCIVLETSRDRVGAEEVQDSDSRYQVDCVQLHQWKLSG